MKNRSGAARQKGRAEIFAALGDRTRLTLMTQLADGQARSISQLTEGTKLTRQAVTKHLRVLEGAGIVQSIRRGRESQFEFSPDSTREARDYLDQVSLQWDQALMRLKEFVEK